MIPDKIYIGTVTLSSNAPSEEYLLPDWHLRPNPKVANIEYIRKDALMKEAVEGRVYDFRRIKEIGYSSAKIEFDKIPELDDGDKVRVIVCKKEEE